MSCSKMETLSASASPFLPQEILVVILSKLPAKSLVRFKCVSKFFCSLVVDHPFADLHRNWSLTIPSRMSILISFPLIKDPNTNWYYTINYSEENQGKLRANRLQYIHDGRNIFRNVYLSSSVNGLICFCRYSRRVDDIAIHNLSTRQHISLPSSCPHVRRDSMSRMNAFGLLGFDSVVIYNLSTRQHISLPSSCPPVRFDPMSRMNACGLLGFDSVSRRYKVLKSVLFTDCGHVSVKHWVFTLGVDKSWREIDSSPFYHPYTCFNDDFYFRTSLHIDGIIYSLNSLNKGGDIVAFDVRAENFQAIPPPPPAIMLVGLDVDGRSGFAEVEGQLAIFHLIRPYRIAIWILKESRVWKKIYSILIPIPLKDIVEFNRRYLFFATNHVGEIAVLVTLQTSVSILFYNFRRKSWRKFDICKLPPPGPVPTVMHFISDNVF